MTVQEAKESLTLCKITRVFMPKNEVIDFVIQALEELEQYRALGTVEQLEWCKDASHWKSLYEEKLAQYESLGTVEELKEAREKQRAKKPIRKHINTIIDSYVCPTCGTEWLFGKTPKYCGICGQKLEEEGRTSD